MIHSVPVSQSAYPDGMRQRVLIAAILISLLAAPLMVREWLGYDALVAGNAERDRAAVHALVQNAEAAHSASVLAVAAYQRALDYNPRDVEAYAGLGALYSQSGDWDWAINAYTRSLQINARQPAMWSGLGLAYEGKAARLHAQWANTQDTRLREANQALQQENLLSAITAYTQTIKLDAHAPTPYLRRGAAKSTLGQLALDQGKRPEARQFYLAAQQDFSQTLALNPARAKDTVAQEAYMSDAYIGIAWTHFKLGESFYDASNLRYLDANQAQAEYTQALNSFETALSLDHDNLNAQSGVGWTWLKLGDIASKSGNQEQAQAAYDKVLEAFARANQIAPSDPQVAVSLGNARWLVSIKLAACRNKSSTPQELAHYEDMIKTALADIGRGIQLASVKNVALDKGAAYYYREQAQLAFILSGCPDQDTLKWYDQAIAYYDKAIAADPINADYIALRGRIAYALGLDYPERRADAYQQAVADLSRSLTMRPDNYETLLYRAAAAYDLAGLQPLTPEGLARRESYALISVNDRQRMVELGTNDAARAQDAKRLAISYLRLGYTNYLQAKYTDALAALDQGLVYNPDYSTLHFVKGLTQLATGDATSAEKSYNAGLDLVKKLARSDRASFLNDAIEDLDTLGQTRPALKASTDSLIQTLNAAR